MMETLICIEDCKPTNYDLLFGSHPIRKGELIQNYYQEGPIISSNPVSITYTPFNTWIIHRGGFHLSYDCKYFMKLSEYRKTQINKILT